MSYEKKDIVKLMNTFKKDREEILSSGGFSWPVAELFFEYFENRVFIPRPNPLVEIIPISSPPAPPPSPYKILH
tara:strand:+ start:9826 stop:10047 length:222 start_codon:yes stop_codon:yes gene_type:complete